MSQLPNSENDNIRIYTNEYVTTNTINRAALRLLENDLWLESLVSGQILSGAVFVDAPSSSVAPGADHEISLSDGYLYIYSPSGAMNWGRIQLDYSW